MARGDFHIHSSASDGRYSSSELVKIAEDQGLNYISLTDHDTTAGIEEAMKSAKQHNIKLIPGIELSTLHNGESIHILGFFKDLSFNNFNFKNFLNEMYLYRIKRAEKIVFNLSRYFDISVDGEKLISETKGVIARPHIAKAIIEAGYKYSFEEIFQKILNNESPAYVPNKNISVSEGIKILKDTNATVILAHPILIKKSPLEELLEYDFDGIEAIYSMNTEEDTMRLLDLADKRNILVSAGSDFHGLGRHDFQHGSIGCVSLSGDRLNKLLLKIGCLL